MSPNVLMVFGPDARNRYLPPTELERLATFAQWDWLSCECGGINDTDADPEAAEHLRQRIADVDALIVCKGAPTVTADLMDAAPRLKFIGELADDRFATRIDLDAAWAHGIRTVDTTNGSSYPVAEWALGLILISLRNAGALFRQILAGNAVLNWGAQVDSAKMLTGKRVGLIGGGHMGRRLIRFLRPFDTEIWVCDPYLPREMAEAVGFVQTSLDNVLSKCDVIVCLVPLTPGTRGMIGQRELNLIPSGAVLVNVSRGAVINTEALIARLKRGDIVAGLDVFEPEPIPSDHAIIQLPNVFLSPHIGWSTGGDYPDFFALMVYELERFFNGHDTWYDLTPRSAANRKGSDPA